MKKEKSKPQQVLHNTTAHYPLTKAEPIPEQQSVPLGQLLPVSTLGMMLCGVEYPFGLFGQLSQMCSPLPQVPVQLLTFRA